MTVIGCRSVIQYSRNLIWPRLILYIWSAWCWFSYGMLINSNNVWIWGIIQICKIFARIWQQGRIQNLHCRGGTSDQWSRRLHWGAKRRKGEGGGGGHPLPLVGVRGVSPGKFWEICIKMVHSERILEVTYTHIYNWKNIYEKRVSLWTYCFKIPLVFKFKMKQFFELYYESDFTVIPFDSLLWRGIIQASPEKFWKIFAKMVQSKLLKRILK